MSGRHIYVETSRGGNLPFAHSSRRNSIRISTYERLRDAEIELDQLTTENSNLRGDLSAVQGAHYSLDIRHESLKNEHRKCGGLRDNIRVQGRQIAGLKNRLDEEKDKTDKLKDEVRYLAGSGNYRQKYEDKIEDVAILQSKLDQLDDLLRRKDAEIRELNDYLREERARARRKEANIANMRH